LNNFEEQTYRMTAACPGDKQWLIYGNVTQMGDPQGLVVEVGCSFSRFCSGVDLSMRFVTGPLESAIDMYIIYI
jgi:hypothetical protein